MITFNPAQGTYVWNGVVDAISVVHGKFSGEKKGAAGEHQSSNAQPPYSNTDTTLTLEDIP